MSNKQSILLFEEIYNKTYQEAYGYVLAKTADLEATPTILRNSYLDFYKYLSRTNNESEKKNRNQLFRIIQKQINDFSDALNEPETENGGRKIKKYKSLLEKELSTELPPIITKAELNKKLNEILLQVSEYSLKARRCFFLYYLFDFTIEQVATELNISAEEAGNHIYLITKKIRTSFPEQ